MAATVKYTITAEVDQKWFDILEQITRHQDGFVWIEVEKSEDKVMGAMKSLLIDISDGMELAGRNLVDAAQAEDSELMEAVMVNVLSALPSYLAALRGEE